MFNLNEQIGKWRENLAQSHMLGTADIDELESHLREEIQSLKQLKLSDEEALLISAHRLGNTSNLSNEYAKINRGRILRQKTSWMIIGVLIYMMVIYCTRGICEGCVQFAIKRGMSSYGGLGLIGLAARILASTMIIFLGYFVYRLAIRIPEIRRRVNLLSGRSSFLIILLVCLVAVFCYGAAFWTPSPVFQNMNIQAHAGVALSYTEILWSVLSPVILAMVLITLHTRNPRDVETQ
jgi:hypothetical protein